jgi:hypothetical protein
MFLAYLSLRMRSALEVNLGASPQCGLGASREEIFSVIIRVVVGRDWAIRIDASLLASLNAGGIGTGSNRDIRGWCWDGQGKVGAQASKADESRETHIEVVRVFELFFL